MIGALTGLGLGLVLGLMVRPPNLGQRAVWPLACLVLPAGLGFGTVMVADPAGGSLTRVIALLVCALMAALGVAGIGLRLRASWAWWWLVGGVAALVGVVGIDLIAAVLLLARPQESMEWLPLFGFAVMAAGPLLVGGCTALGIYGEERERGESDLAGPSQRPRVILQPRA